MAMPVSGLAFLLSFLGDRSIWVVFYFLLICEDISPLSLPTVISVSSYILFCILFDVR